MRRRAFVGGLGAVLAAPMSGSAQPPGRPARVGLLDPVAPSPSRQRLWEAFRQRLRQLGFRDGEHVTFELRSAEGQPERLAGLATELVRLNVDVIVSATTPASLAAKRATTTIPIVMTNSGDPVSSGLVASLSRPGGNVTGLTTLSPALSAKRLEVLKEIVPTTTRVALLWEEINPAFASAVRETQAAARSLGIQVVVFGAKVVADIERAFVAMAAQHADAVIIMPGAIFTAGRRAVTELAVKYRLPSVYSQREYVDAGGLVSYGASQADLYARAADFVAKILKGAKPVDLPVEQPTTFELVINLKTAKALGLVIPPSLQLRADAIVE